MPQFNDGGAMLMLYQTPENVTEEHWDEPGVDVLSFHGNAKGDTARSLCSRWWPLPARWT